MAQQGAVPAAEDRRQTSSLSRYGRVPHGIDTVMNLVESPYGYRVSDFVLGVAERRQLPDRHDAVLFFREPGQRMVTSPFFAHIANKGEVSGGSP